MQSLRINAFFGSSDLRIFGSSEIGCGSGSLAQPTFLSAIVEKRLRLSPSLNEIFQILSLTMFEKTPMDQLEQAVATEDYVPTYDHCPCWTLLLSIIDHFSKAKIRNYNPASEDNTENGSCP